MAKTYKNVQAQATKEGETKKFQFPVYWKGGLVDKVTSEFPKFDNEELTWKYLPVEDVEVEFTVTVNAEYEMVMGKAGKVVAGYIVHKGIPMFGSLSAQGCFKVLHKLTNISVSKLDSLYKASNPARKDGKKVEKTKVEW